LTSSTQPVTDMSTEDISLV